MKNIEQFKEYSVIDGMEDFTSGGVFEIPMEGTKQCLVCLVKNNPWEIARIQVIDLNEKDIVLGKILTQREITSIRNMLFEDNDVVVEFYPDDNVFSTFGEITLYSSKEIKVPDNRMILNDAGKVITLPQNKMMNIRTQVIPSVSDPSLKWERLNVRTMNKKGHLSKKYASSSEMALVKKMFFEDADECVCFRFPFLNEDNSMDLYKCPVGTMPPKVNYTDNIPVELVEAMAELGDLLDEAKKCMRTYGRKTSIPRRIEHNRLKK